MPAKTHPLILIFIGAALLFNGCIGHPKEIPTDPFSSPSLTSTVQPSAITPTPFISDYAFPGSIDPSQKYFFYVHGKIIEDNGIPAISPDFGEYEYQAILEKLASYGFVVISEQRTKDTDATEYAKKIVSQVKILLNAGVPEKNIIVAGASKGAWITVYVSHLLENKKANFVILSVCNTDAVEAFEQNKISLYGNVLSIFDSADVEYSGSCEGLFSYSELNGGLSSHNEIMTNLGVGHGLVYKPYDEWIIPSVEWTGK